MMRYTLLATMAITPTLPAVAQSLTHVKQISIADEFNLTSDLGDNPLSVAFDGVNAFVGGYNNTNAMENVGMLKIENVLGVETLTPLASTVQATNAFTGYNELEYEATTDDLYANLDKGSANISENLVERRSNADGSVVWSVNPFSDATGTERVKALAIDQADTAASPFLSAIAPNSGRRMGLSLVDGSFVYGPTGSAPAGGIILGDVNGTVDFGTSWNALAMDSDGNLATIEKDFIGYTTRTGDNTFQAPSGANERQDEIFRRAEQIFPGEDIVILEDLLGPGQDVLAISVRTVTMLEQLDGTIQTIDSTNVLLRNLDGSTSGLTQLELTGGENGIGSMFASDIKSLAYGSDADGNPTLVVVDFEGRTVDVYQQLQSPSCDFSGDGLCDIVDVNQLLAVGDLTVGVMGADPKFDLNGDMVVDETDLDLWLAGAATQNGLASPYRRGDANLDAVTDVSDFNQWNSNKFTDGMQWDFGDFNGDGAVDVSDFNLWNGNKFSSSDAAVMAVPEPRGVLAMWTACMMCGWWAQRRRGGW